MVLFSFVLQLKRNTTIIPVAIFKKTSPKEILIILDCLPCFELCCWCAAIDRQCQLWFSKLSLSIFNLGIVLSRRAPASCLLSQIKTGARTYRVLPINWSRAEDGIWTWYFQCLNSSVLLGFPHIYSMRIKNIDVWLLSWSQEASFPSITPSQFLLVSKNNIWRVNSTTHCSATVI